jgi:hypothetical protein
MSAIVDIVLAEHKDVLTVPVAAIVEGASGTYCWVQQGDQVKKRAIRVGDTNDQFSVILDGLNEGDAVILNPLAFVDEAQEIAIEPGTEGSATRSDSKRAAPQPAANSQSGTGS